MFILLSQRTRAALTCHRSILFVDVAMVTDNENDGIMYNNVIEVETIYTESCIYGTGAGTRSQNRK